MGLSVLVANEAGKASSPGRRSCESRVLVISSKQRSRSQTQWINSSQYRARCRSKPTRKSCRGNTATWPCTDRKSTRLNSSHSQISYAVFCLKKKNQVVSREIAAQLDKKDL